MAAKDQHKSPLAITKMAFGGYGIATTAAGKKIFVEGAVTGDEVYAELTTDKSSYGLAKISRFLKKSPLRHASPCPYMQQCGGCQWLDIPYEQQKEWKKQFVLEALERIGKFKALPPLDFYQSKTASADHYRNRILLRGRLMPNGQVTVGFFQRASREQVPVSHCYVAAQSLNTVIAQLAGLTLSPAARPQEPQKFRLELQEFLARDGNQGACVTALVHPVGKELAAFTELIASLQSFPEVLWAGLEGHAAPPILPIETIEGLSYFSTPGQFYQIHLPANASLRKLIQQEVDRQPEACHLLDLYCGAGNLSLSLANGRRRIFGVEGNALSIAAAKYAVAYNQLEGLDYTAQEAVSYLKDLIKNCQAIDLVIADPPRAGMKEAIPYLRQLNPQTIIYVSCNPATLARDLAALASDYRLDALFAFDFFPHTFHVESCAILHRL